MSQNHIQNVAVIGAGGRTGRSVTEALLKNDKHLVTAITRLDSTTSLPDDLHAVAKVDYSNHASLVHALRGQDALVIILSVMAPKESQTQLIDAAVEAGVRYIIPNEWAVGLAKVKVSEDVFMRDRLLPAREQELV